MIGIPLNMSLELKKTNYILESYYFSVFNFITVTSSGTDFSKNEKKLIQK